MKDYDVKSEIENQIKYNPDTFLQEFGGRVAEETGKVGIKYELKTRAHIFQDGEAGEIADKLTIEIDFSNATIQPHSTFEDDFCSRAIDAIQDNVNGLLENAE